jgi:hypothetical protein
MKNILIFRNSILSLLAIGFFFISCSESDDSIEADNTAETILEIQRSSEIDQVDSVLGELVIKSYEEQETESANTIPECVTVTIIAQQNFREVTLDFGNEGCFVNGHLLKGQIIYDYTRNPEAQEVTINYNLVDFYFDNKNVIGTRSIFRELANENGNPQFTHDLSITVIWPNGVQASREGTRIREWVEGFGSGTFDDNVFEITGDWTANFVNGNTHSYEVMMPLRREMTCAYFVSGTLDVQRTNFSGMLDYGDNECDNQATFTFNNGQEVAITLD